MVEYVMLVRLINERGKNEKKKHNFIDRQGKVEVVERKRSEEEKRNEKEEKKNIQNDDVCRCLHPK